MAAIVLIAGLVHAVSLAWPFAEPFDGGAAWLPARGVPLWPLQWAALAVLAWHWRHAVSARQALWQGWCFATAWLAATFWWLVVAMHVYGGLWLWLSLVAVVLLAAFLASYYAVLGYVLRRWMLQRPLAWGLAFACCWTLAEGLRSWVLTGFGWGGVGYAWVDGPLSATYPWVGVFGAGWLAAALAAVPAVWMVLGQRVRSVVLAVCAAGLLLGWLLPPAAQNFTASSGVLRVELLQGAIPQDEKFEMGTGIPLALDWYGAQLRSAQSDLVLAPETAIPLLPYQLPGDYLSTLQQHFAASRTTALVGIPLGNQQVGYTNSMLAWGSNPALAQWRYDKHHLVPFGEFIPPLFKWFMRLMSIPLDSFARGDLGQVPLPVAGQLVAPNICYEDLYSEEIATRFAKPDQQPTILANVSNLAWFGNTVALDQHLHISRVRAMEFQRPVLRATNTGATAIVSHTGQVVVALPYGERAVLQAAVQGRSGLTPYARWVAAYGLWPLWALCLLLWWGLWRWQQGSRP
ncbi:apolipoprotein N-acyltransferase [Curvibacter sp. CHRR-16]|uniref:apolipoprotein N-acyltransferase n=1 Tax=Curvibacter sp. CHRR-16 TaxID=2835872 RepID=UPI0032E9FED2